MLTEGFLYDTKILLLWDTSNFMTKPSYAGIREGKQLGGVCFKALWDPFLATKRSFSSQIFALYGAYGECWHFFFSAQKSFNFSKQNFQMANEQKFKSCKFAAVVCGERKTVPIKSAKDTRM